jgi:hypothetical protein
VIMMITVVAIWSINSHRFAVSCGPNSATEL